MSVKTVLANILLSAIHVNIEPTAALCSDISVFVYLIYILFHIAREIPCS